MQEYLGYNILWNEIVDSTQNLIARMAGSLPDKTVLAAHFQTAGRGQGDHSWTSADGENLTFSILLKFGEERPLLHRDEQLLTKATSLAVKDFLEHLGIEAKIKKPNDIYVKSNKICGMLIENGASGDELDWSILGIGINMNQRAFPEDLPNAVSATMLTGLKYPLKECLCFFLEDFDRRIEMIFSARETLEKEYEESLVSFSYS